MSYLYHLNTTLENFISNVVNVGKRLPNKFRVKQSKVSPFFFSEYKNVNKCFYLEC